jgi:TetR/AcrR family transcriptional regulator, fatty acid metabolism regulator protein
MVAGSGQPTTRQPGKGTAQTGLGSGKKGSQGTPQERISRKQQAEDTRRKLAETALRLFAERGYERVAVDDICREAGVSKGTFYVYFASKDQVLVEELLDLDRFYLDSLPEIDKADTGIARLLAFGRYSLRHISALGKDYIKAAYSSQMAPGRGPSSLASRERGSYEVALRLVREAQEGGALRCDLSSEEIALALVRAIRGIVIEWCLNDGGFDLEREGEPLLGILLDGLKAREERTGKRAPASTGRKRRG